MFSLQKNQKTVQPIVVVIKNLNTKLIPLEIKVL
jgi:hypothetical protein